MDEQQDWIQQIKKRDLTGPMHLILDTLEPLGALGAQLLWVLQPVSGLWGGRSAVAEIAEALETPDGLDKLRQRLDDPSS